MSHLVIFGMLVATLAAIAGLDDGNTPGSTSGVAPTTPAPILASVAFPRN